MKLKGCSCRACKRGKRACHSITRGKIKGARSKVKTMIRKGKLDELPKFVYIGYTD